jgi:hypothetical protein
MDPKDRDRSGQRRPAGDSDTTISIDIAEWLRGLALEQYAPAFVANDIDGEVLPELTADDLIGLGVTSIGHRRKLLAAIAALRAKAPQAAAEAAPAAALLGLIVYGTIAKNRWALISGASQCWLCRRGGRIAGRQPRALALSRRQD